jgi:predicted dienelactone hydrolase
MARLISAITAPLRRLARLFGRTAPPGDPAPPDEPATRDGSFVDTGRGRSVPYRIWTPQGADGPAPAVIFSHGLGGSRAAAPYLGRALAEAGYWGVFIQHQGSDARLIEGLAGQGEIRQALQGSLANPGNMVNRFLDLPFVIDELERLNAEAGPFQGRIDTGRIGAAGHSYGARTVLAAAGQWIGLAGAEFKEPRLRAGVALSPSGGRGPGENDPLPAEHFAAIDIPLLHVTGTEDRTDLVDSDFDPYVRTLPFQHIPCDDQFLLVLHGARHNDFSGTLQGGDPAPDNRYTIITSEVAVLFFDAYLKGEETAWYNLRNLLAEHLDPEDYYEFR